MKIEAITLRELRIPLVHFFETSFGRTRDRRILLCTVHADGLEGWGECVAGEAPYYSEEYIEGAWDVSARYLAPALLGKTLQSGSEVPALLARIRNRRAESRQRISPWCRSANSATGARISAPAPAPRGFDCASLAECLRGNASGESRFACRRPWNPGRRGRRSPRNFPSSQNARWIHCAADKPCRRITSRHTDGRY